MTSIVVPTPPSHRPDRSSASLPRSGESGPGAHEDALRDERSELRRPARVRVGVLLNGRSVDLLTENVSARGAFIRSSEVVTPRNLVRLRLVLPPYDEVLTAPAMVVHAADGGADLDTLPGFGVRFVGLDGEPRDRWMRFVRYVDGTLGQPTPPEDPHDASDLTPYRPLVDLAIAAPTQASLEALVRGEVARGRVLIPSEVPVLAATPVRVHLVHPITGETFVLDGTVDRWDRIAGRGIAAVELVRLTHGLSRRLAEFVSGICIDSDVDVADAALSQATGEFGAIRVDLSQLTEPLDDPDKTRETPVAAMRATLASMRESDSRTKILAADRLEALVDAARARPPAHALEGPGPEASFGDPLGEDTWPAPVSGPGFDDPA